MEALFVYRQVLPAVSCEVLADLQSEALKHDIIGIDEGQFVSKIFVSEMNIFHVLIVLKYLAIVLVENYI